MCQSGLDKAIICRKDKNLKIKVTCVMCVVPRYTGSDEVLVNILYRRKSLEFQIPNMLILVFICRLFRI